MSLRRELQATITKFNEMFKHLKECGHFYIETDLDVIVNQCHFTDYKEGDVAVMWDLKCDDLIPIEAEIMVTLISQCFDELAAIAKGHVFDSDGSGNGLYYGITIYRP